MYIFYFLQTIRNVIGLKWSRGNRVYSVHCQYIFNTWLVVELSPFFFQNKDDVEQRDPGAFALTTVVEIINKRIIFFIKYYNKKMNWPELVCPPNVSSMTWPM